jgi:diguanylate cyclase (GGDEF)-like protein/PAS domain S-box-containing protein
MNRTNSEISASEQAVTEDLTASIMCLTERLHMSEATLCAIGEIAEFGIFITDSAGCATYINRALLEMLGQTADEAVNGWHEAIHPDDRERVLREWAECTRAATVYRSRLKILGSIGNIIVDVVAAPIHDVHGAICRFAGTVQDVTNQLRVKEAEDARRKTERQYRQIVDTAQEGVWLRDADGLTNFVNQRLCDMLGYTADEMMGRPVYDFMDAEARAEAERRFARRRKGESQQHDVRYKHKNGADVWTIVSASPVYDDDGVFIGALGVITDITERKRKEETVLWQAHHDALTGLPNRRLLEDRLHQILVISERQPLHVAVLFIDLDRFKLVNDSLGHDCGDLLLKTVAQRISGCLRAEDTIARMGGDEFCVLVPGIEHPKMVAKVALKILVALAQPIDLGVHEFTVGGSIGVSLHPTDGNDVASLIKNADIAMYRAKEQGGGAYCLFQQS